MKVNKHYSESELIKGIREHNNQCLNLIYKANYPVIEHLIISNNGTIQEAKDIFQESVIVLYEKLNDPEFELSCLIKTFIYSICRRLWLKRLNEKNKYSGKLTDFDEFIQIDDELSIEAEENEKRFKTMQKSLNELGEPCATIIVDFYIEKKSMQEITQKMGYTNADNAKNQKYKCLQRLKKLFFQEYETDNHLNTKKENANQKL